MSATEIEIISKEFLEKALEKKVESFTIESHSDSGDNFMSIIYTLDVNVISSAGKQETLHLISKCYPNNAGRQEYLNGQNIFWKELQIYKCFLPELVKFQENLGLQEIIQPDFPELAAGHALNHQETKLGGDYPGKVFQPFDNYLMLVDLKKTFGYQTADRFAGLDFEHVSLAVEALAKFHALSWSYKRKHNIDKITSKFPFMYYDFTIEKDKKMFQQMVLANTDQAIEALKAKFGSDSHLERSLTSFKENNALNVINIVYHYSDETEVDLWKYLRINQFYQPNPEPQWNVVMHGDTNMNNMLFGYNPATNKPEKIALVDLQVCQDGCPTTDLAYFLYTSTTTELRRKHLQDILEMYFKKFTHYCKLLQTETLPGFTLSELKRRFHRKKVFGFCIGLTLLPFFLKEKEKAVQMDSLTGMSQEEIFVSAGKGVSENKIYAKRITDLVQEIYEDGIL